VMVLRYGLMGVGKMRDGILNVIDGQKCGQTIDGTIIIEDARSPYNGMAVSDYRELIKSWFEHKREIEKNKLRQMQREARENGRIAPTQLPSQAPHKVSRESLPKWPEGVRNHLEAIPKETKTKHRVRKS
jgi:hypothetical protein